MYTILIWTNKKLCHFFSEFMFIFKMKSRSPKNKLFLNNLINTVHFLHECILPLGSMCWNFPDYSKFSLTLIKFKEFSRCCMNLAKSNTISLNFALIVIIHLSKGAKKIENWGPQNPKTPKPQNPKTPGLKFIIE